MNYVDLSATAYSETSPLAQRSPHNTKRLVDKMFAVVGLTLDDVWSGSLPQVRLAEALKARSPRGNSGREGASSILIYTTDPSDTQGLVARARYKEKGTFVTLLYFNDAAVAACNELHIPLNILEHLDESGLPAKRVIAFEHPSTAPVTR